MTSSRKSWMSCQSYGPFIEKYNGCEVTFNQIEEYHNDECKYGNDKCFNTLTNIFQKKQGVSFIDKETPITLDSPFGFELRHGKVFLTHKMDKDTKVLIIYENKKDENGKTCKGYCNTMRMDNIVREDTPSKTYSKTYSKTSERTSIPYDEKFIDELIEEFID